MTTIEIKPRTLGRFGFLLIALTLFLITAVIAENTTAATIRFRIAFTAVLLVGCYSMRGRRSLVIAALLAVPALVGQWLHLIAGLEQPSLVPGALNVIFLSYVAVVVLAAVLSERRVSTDTILGGICVYLLLGIIWAMLYSIAIVVQPEAILVFGEPIDQTIEDGSVVLLYYSFVTLTTLGYGDVIPYGGAARMLAAAEGVVGQLFVAVLIARLVGLHISAGREE